MSALTASLIAGAVAGAAGFALFLVVHALWIVPIWDVAATGPLAAGFGLAAGWAFHEWAEHGRLPAAPLHGPAFAGLLYATLAPVALIGVLAGPVPTDRVDFWRVLPPLLAALPAGALLGWLLAGSRRAALAFGLAALALAITIGHNLPFFPIGARGAPFAFGSLLGVEMLAAIVLVAARSLLARPAGAREAEPQL